MTNPELTLSQVAARAHALGPLAKAASVIEAEEAQRGPLPQHDRRRIRFVSAASNVPADVIRHVLRTRDNDRRKTVRQV